MISVEELKRHLPTCDVVAHDLYGIAFKRKVAGCPFPENHHHGDHDPSLRYDAKKDRIFCASQQCFGAKGVDAIALVQKMELLDFPAAIEKLQGHYGPFNGTGMGPSRRLTETSPLRTPAQRVRESLGRQGFHVVSEYPFSAELRKIRFEHESNMQPVKGRPEKTCRWEHFADGDWWSGDGDKPKPLYVNKLLREADAGGTVLGFEGEGKVDLAGELGFAAFSYKESSDDNVSTLGQKELVLWPDNDTPGRAEANRAATIIQGSSGTGEVRIVEQPVELPESGDIIDAVTKLNWGRKEIEELILRAERFSLQIRENSSWPDDPQPLGDALPPPEAQPTDDDSEIARLAALPLLEYERQREAAAERLGVRVPILDKLVGAARGGKDSDDRGQGKPFAPAEIEPWPQPVAGSQLLDDHVAAVRRHVILAETEAQAVALWVIHAHAHGQASISPLLAVSSPTPACGKSVLLKLLRLLVPRPLAVSNLTAASLFRAIERWGPTLLIDEADSYLKQSEDLRGILNSGHDRELAFVLRTIGDDHEPRSFCTWAPKAVAAIGRLPTTILSRSVHIQLQRMRGNERVDRLSGGRAEALKLLARKAARWVGDHADNLGDDPPTSEQLRGRNADNWRPLIAIADQAGGPWPERARAAALALSGGEDTEALGVLLLHDLAGLFDQRQVERIPTAEIIEALGRMETRPWPELSRGKPITARKMAGLLGGFGVKPRTVRADGGNTPKGYFRGDLDDALARYPRNASATTPQNPVYGPQSDSQSATSPVGVADSKGAKPLSLLVGGGVADRNPETRPVAGNIAPSRLDDNPEPSAEWRETEV